MLIPAALATVLAKIPPPAMPRFFASVPDMPSKSFDFCSKNCVNPDYIKESLNLFLDSLNMFSNIYHARDN